MKHCPACFKEFPDKYRFCQYDQTPLVEAVAPQRVVPLGVTSPVEAWAVPPNLPGGGYSDASAHAPSFPPADEDQTVVAPRPSAPRGRGLLLAGVAGAVVLVAAVVLTIYFLSGSVVKKNLEEAVARGDLLTPPGANAYELYHQLKLEGADASELARFHEKLLPLVTPKPRRLLEGIATPGFDEPGIAEWEEASKLLTWASEMMPGDKTFAAQADYCAGRIAYLSNRKDEALTHWKRASELDTSWALPTNGVGLLYNERRDYPTARQYLLEATRRRPDWALPYNNLGTSYYYERDYDQAEYYYQKAVEHSPRWARPHAWLGDIAMHRRDYGRAVQEFEAVLASDAQGTQNIDLGKIGQKLEEARQLASQSEMTFP